MRPGRISLKEKSSAALIYFLCFYLDAKLSLAAGWQLKKFNLKHKIFKPYCTLHSNKAVNNRDH